MAGPRYRQCGACKRKRICRERRVVRGEDVFGPTWAHMWLCAACEIMEDTAGFPAKAREEERDGS